MGLGKIEKLALLTFSVATILFIKESLSTYLISLELKVLLLPVLLILLNLYMIYMFIKEQLRN